MSDKVLRMQHRAYLKENLSEKVLAEKIKICHEKALLEKEQGKLMSVGMFRYQKHLFLYLEIVGKEEAECVNLPERLFSELTPLLEAVPKFSGKNFWIPMTPVFWFDEPNSAEQWKRVTKVDEQCGRIAILQPDRLMSYVYHHQAIVREGLFKGDRYQFISIHENVLFSYYEDPRDREWVNRKKTEGDSLEIALWEQADPESHFYHFPEAEGANFFKIPSLFTVG